MFSFAGLMLCQIEPVYLDSPLTGCVFDVERALSNCKALKVTMFVI